jgi:hypothetical protein
MVNMKYAFLVIFVILSFFSHAQNNSQIPPLDKSPMDMSYYPINYPILKIQGKLIEPLVMRVIYSRPNRNGRKVFGGLQEYGEVWRLGANEATEIEFFKNVRINNKLVRKGRYTLFAIPYPDKWTLIINKDTDVWGSFNYNSEHDVLRVDLPVRNNEMVETMAIFFEKVSGGANMNIVWEDISVTLPVSIY